MTISFSRCVCICCPTTSTCVTGVIVIWSQHKIEEYLLRLGANQVCSYWNINKVVIQNYKISMVVILKQLQQLCNTVKTCDTTVTGHSMAAGSEFQHHTHTHGTRDRNTTSKPTPMLFPSKPTGIWPKTCEKTWNLQVGNLYYLNLQFQGGLFRDFYRSDVRYLQVDLHLCSALV